MPFLSYTFFAQINVCSSELETSWKVAIVAFSVTCEVVKQCTSFATRYYADDGQYPVPQTALVLAVELIKLVSVSVILLKTGTYTKYRLRSMHVL